MAGATWMSATCSDASTRKLFLICPTRPPSLGLTKLCDTMASDRQANLEQTLTSVISLLETEQNLKKVSVSSGSARRGRT